MFTAFLLALREAFEASLVVGIILVELARTDRRNLNKYVHTGIGVGAAVCILLGVPLFLTVGSFRNNSILEGIIMLFAALFIVYIPFWLHRNTDKEQISKKLGQNIGTLSLFLLAFFSVFREGMELVVFILAEARKSAYDVSLGVILGIAIAVLLTIVLFKTSLKLNISAVFTVLGLILIYWGGSLFSEGWAHLFEIPSTLVMALQIIFILGALVLLYQRNIRQKLKKAA
jgi:high-affinity iron transporter